MHLKSLSLKGFKSFPDKTLIEFPKGIISVVGPNGSGKSNILDAVRWVLGEQSVKSLRGEKLQDVIFSGTTSRSPMGVCEVVLTLDNEDNSIDIPFSEISIKRKLYRDGDSKFYINNKGCRLKDIKELLLDTGIGKEGYSLITQGRIEKIVNSSSEDRRLILEEASGIAKYRYKKEEGEKNLKATQENLERINDIYKEIEGTIKPLEEQKEKAEKFLYYKEQLKIYQVNKALREYNKLVEKKDNLNKELIEIEENLKVNEENLSKEQLNLEKNKELKLELIEKQENSENIKQNILEEKEQLERDKMLYEEKINNNKNSILEYEEEKIKIETSINNSKEKIENVEKNKLKIEEEIKTVIENIEKIENEIKEENLNTEALQLKINNLNLNLQEIQDSLTEKNIRIDFSKSNLKSLEEKIIEYNQKIEEFQGNQKVLQEEKTNLESKITQLNEILSSLDSEKKEFENKNKDLNNILNNTREEINKINFRKNDISYQINILEKMQDNLQGYSKATKEIIKNKNLQGIINPLGEIIKVKKGYEKAIEVLLGYRIQNIIIENSNNAKEAINFLKKNNLGRATFLPLDTVSKREFSYKDLGVKAIDILEFDPKFQNLMSNLLNRMIIVNTMEDGLKISKKYNYSLKIATLDGEVFNIGGSITGGSSGTTVDIFSRRKKLTDYKNAYEKIVNELKEKTEKTKEIQTTLSENIQNYEKAKEKIYDLINKTGEIQKTYESKNLQYNSLINEIKRNQAEKANIENTLAELSKSLEKDSKIIEEKNKEKETVEEEIAQLKQNYEEKYKNALEIQKNLTNLEMSKIKLEEKLTFIVETLENEKESLSEVISNLQISEEKIKSSQSNIEKLKYKLEENSENTEIILNKQIELEKVISEIQTNIQQYNQLIKQIEEKIENIEKEKSENNSKTYKIQNERSKFTFEMDFISRQIQTDYNLNMIQCKQYENIDLKIENSVINNLKNQLESLGNVNLDSIEQFKKINERYILYKTQKEDLEISIEKITKIIKDLEKNMELDFKESYNQINENFNTVFRQLFGGGNAKLSITDEKDVLNSPIEISVSLPGKKINSLASLSGGEKALCAMALSFAIIKLNPVPFCILDEVDAPLDDVNVERFSGLLQGLKENTQFITITHRRGTMESADYLYGVTMNEKGVSKTVSLKLEDASQYVQ